MNVFDFQAKWRGVSGTERGLAQSHFNDLCALAGLPPDAMGTRYGFEQAVTKAGGGTGFADVWFPGRFALEYKGRGKDLDAAYVQLLQYKDALENPPLLVVSDLDRIIIHPNFTGRSGPPLELTLDRLHEPEQQDVLRKMFHAPEDLRPGTTKEQVTREAAAHFGALAAAIQARGEAPRRVAHFLMQVLFCLFAEDVGVLQRGLFTKLLAIGRRSPDHFSRQATELFRAMATGGWFGADEIPHVNGGLFANVDVPALTAAELATLETAAGLDWAGIEPAIFGTLFERSLDPAKRAQLGAHYTGWADIERVVEPVIMAPLRRRWADVRAQADALLRGSRSRGVEKARSGEENDVLLASSPPRLLDSGTRRRLADLLAAFRAELAAVRVLDPACGSGNFLYVTLAKLLDLEKSVSAYGALNGLPFSYPTVRPEAMLGLEINGYARELAQVALWIGYLQWMIDNGGGWQEPILAPLDTIREQDALLDRTDPDHVTEAVWPSADFIVGNPPFLGGKLIRSEISGEYADTLHRVFSDRLPPFADLCCYFFEKARAEIAAGKSSRAGLLATNSIRGGANRRVLDRIKQSGDIFTAWDDEPWVLDGAAVRISIIGFDDGSETYRTLDGESVSTINADLSTEVDITKARRLPENRSLAFEGDQKAGAFEIDEAIALRWLSLPLNPNGRHNSDVVRPWANGYDVVRRPNNMWIVDFGVDMTQQEAALYEAPFEHVLMHVKPVRATNREASRVERWWLHARPRPELRQAIQRLDRIIMTVRHSKYRLWVWARKGTIPDSALVAVARDDDYFFGVLHSRAHEVWSLRMGTSLEDRPRYTPTTCFETFPFPWPPGQEPGEDDDRVRAIAAAARELDRLRQNHLNPPDAGAATLKTRTLTNLYNARPTWLTHAHAALDRAVWAAYAWDDPDPATVPEETILERLLALNGERASTSVAGSGLATS